MSDGPIIVLVVGISILLILAVFAVVRMHHEGGMRPFFWPRFSHGYEVATAMRLASVPWMLLLAAMVLNALSILAFGEDLLGHAAGGSLAWLVFCAIPLLMIHLVDYRRSIIGAGLTVVLVVAAIVLLIGQLHFWPAAILLLPLLLWSVNGLRAAVADRTA